jgi:hypothetical protein
MPEVIARLVGGDQKFALLDQNVVLKVEPLIPLSDMLDRVEDLLYEGRTEDALKYLHALKDPRAFLVRGMVCKATERISTDAIERYIRTDLEREILERQNSEGVKRAYDTLITINSELSRREKFAFQKERITFWMLKNPDSGQDHKVLAVKYIPTYIVEYKHGSVEGQWRFPECFVGLFLDMSGDKLTVSGHPWIIKPKNYTHPFVFQNGGVCLGSFKREQGELSRLTLSRKILLMMRTTEQVLRSGYNRGKGSIAPANGHLPDNRFKRFKVSESVSQEYRERMKALKKTRKIAREAEGE